MTKKQKILKVGKVRKYDEKTMPLVAQETFKIWVFLEKYMGFLRKSLKFFKNATCGNFFLKCLPKLQFFFSKCLSTFFLKFFLAKNEKKIKIGKVRKYDGETEYFEKTAFILLKGIFNNVGGHKISRR